ncbi:uncharacterized protein LOC142219932 [Haematobia irritans]|uniref:uncharacterized protein LOC142219932 n=1 Tax=Haematobia irritans TaxID=7368 RepID=UPI003F5041B5
MAGFSKFFEEHVKHQSCQSLGLHQDSCLVNYFKDLLRYALSNLKYFAPVCLLPIVINWHSLSKKKIRQYLEYYLHCSSMGAFIGYIINALICLLRKGHFGIYNFVFVPSLFGAASLHFLGSDRVIQLFETSIFQCNIETLLLMRRFFISRLISDSKILQTYIFMISSAIILQGKLLYNTKGFWLMEANPKPAENENQECYKCELHPKASCKQYVFEGVRKYFLLGLTLDLVKSMMSKVNTVQNQSKLMGKVKNFRIRSTALLTANIGIYRSVHCFLNRYMPQNNSLNHLMSAFLAGFCYNFYPQTQLFTFALVHALRTLWTIIRIENIDSKNGFLQWLLQAPMGRALFPFSVAHMVHIDCLKSEYSSGLGSAITNAITNKYPVTIRRQMELLKKQVGRM